MAPGVEEEGPRHRDPCVQVPQVDEDLLLPAGPGQGDGLLAPSGGMEAETLGSPDDWSSVILVLAPALVPAPDPALP